MRQLAFILVWLWALLVPAFAQMQGQLTQQSPTRLDACTGISTSVASAATITITPPSGQYVYLCTVDIQNCAGVAVTGAAPLTMSTTNLGGLAYTIGTGSTAGICQPQPAAWAAPYKSAAPGVAVTLVLPTFTTNQVIRVTAFYYYGF